MKKLITCLLLTLTLCASNVFAEVNVKDRNLTIGETFTIYFEQIFPLDSQTYKYVKVRFTDVRKKSRLEKALEKAIYHKMLENRSSVLHVDELMTERDFAKMVFRHFGAVYTPQDLYLNSSELLNFMKQIDNSFVFELLRKTNEGVAQPKKQVNEGIEWAEGFDVLNQVYKYVSLYHYQSATFDNKKLLYGAARGLVEATWDEYTTFFDPVGSQNFEDKLHGEYFGIGIYIDLLEPGKLIIISPLPGSPAEQAGIKNGDQIVTIDDTPVDKSLSLEQATYLIKGKKWTKVRLTILRSGNEQNFEITRDHVKVSFVTHKEISPSTYYIKIQMFGSDVDKEFKLALQQIIDRPSVRRIVFDVRGNPGGGLTEVVQMLNFLLPKNSEAVAIKTKSHVLDTRTKEDPLLDLTTKEVVVLVNKGTASASEIFAAALKEYFTDHVKLLGTRTYGKGTVQQVIGFEDKSSLKLTTAEWLVGRSRKSINKVGITPDVEIASDWPNQSGYDRVLEEALSVRF